MKRVVRSIRVLALVIALVPVMPVFAEQARGFYVGVGAGNAEADLGVGDMDQLFRDAFRAQGATYVPQLSSVDNKDSSLYVFAGYRIFPWLSAEAGYVDLGSVEYSSRGTFSTFGGGVQQNTIRMDVESRGVAASALGNLPLGDYFEIHGRVGIFGVSTDADVRGGTTSRPINTSDSSVTFSLQLGAGAAVHLGEHFSLSADWVHFFGIDNDFGNEDADAFDYDGYDVDILRLSAILRFSSAASRQSR